MPSKLLVVLFATLGFSLTAVAAPITYTTDANHTFASFSYNHLGFSDQTSRFNTVSGTVTYDAAAKTGVADITIDTKSVDTGSTLFNGHIQSEDFLSTAQFPTATFKSNKFVFSDNKLTSIQGVLTLKGVSKPVTLDVTNIDCKKHPMNGADACGANAVAKVKRSDFNMSKYVPSVTDEVTIRISIEASAK
jgi:polyisoprenoid-binding protein YceI